MNSEYLANMELAASPSEQTERLMNERAPVKFEDEVELGDENDMSTWGIC